jgi:lysophospholipase L1-like esterase
VRRVGGAAAAWCIAVALFVGVFVSVQIPADGASPSAHYAAIGDSYASGEGNPTFDPGTGGHDEATNRCHRSPKAWPRLLGTPASAHLACSGADVASLYANGGNDTASTSQIDRLAAISPRPDTVFITVGGNDLGFSGALAHCFVLGLLPGTCFGDGDLRATLDRIARLGPRLEALYRDVARRIGSRVVVVTYPRLFPASGSRTGCHWLDRAAERRMVAAGAALNREILRRAEAAGVSAVDVFDAFTGHELCTRHPMFVKVSALRGLLAYSAHPNAVGQRAIADRVASALNRYTAQRHTGGSAT